MSHILTIQPQKKHPNRVNLFIDDRFFAGLDAELLSELDLKNGTTVDESFQNRILTISEYDKARTFVLRSLTKADQPRSALEKKLKSKKYDDSVISRILNECEMNNYINDERYARSFIHDKVKFRNWGKGKIRSELVKKGLAAEIINRCLSEVEVTDETDIKLVSKIRKKYHPLTDLKNQQKAIRYLQYRGYGWEDISRIIKDKTSRESD